MNGPPTQDTTSPCNQTYSSSNMGASDCNVENNVYEKDVISTPHSDATPPSTLQWTTSTTHTELNYNPSLPTTTYIRKKVIASKIRILAKRSLKGKIFEPNKTVCVIIGNILVTIAVLLDGQNGNICRKLHRQEPIGSPGQDFVVMNSIVIAQKMKRLPYNYHCRGPE